MQAKETDVCCLLDGKIFVASGVEVFAGAQP